jgi:hypothetical protein
MGTRLHFEPDVLGQGVGGLGALALATKAQRLLGASGCVSNHVRPVDDAASPKSLG